MQLNDSWILKYTKLYVTPLVHQKLTYLPVGSTDKLKSVSPGNQNQKLLQLMFFFYKLESAFHVYISSISSTHKSHQEDLSGRSHGNSCSSSVFNTAVISAGIGAIRQRSTKDQAKSNKFNIATGQRSSSSLSRKIDIARHKSQHYGRLNVSDVTNSMLVASPLRESARNPYQQKRHIYCQGNNINPACTTI